jgi:diacylglycerol kinase family enzyme
MGKHLGLAWEPQNIGRQVAHTIEHHRVAHLDVAQMSDGIFLLMAGVGFDAWVVHELDRLRSGPIDYTSYVAPALKAWTSYEFPKLTVTVDADCVYRDGPALCLVGNIPEYGTGFPLLPLARPDDQLLDVCVMPCASRLELMKLALAAAAGEHVKQEGVVYCKGKHVTIHSPQPVPVQVDGEPAGTTPVEINLLPGRIPFMVPI